MVVVHPDHVVGLQQRHQPLGEPGIDLLIGPAIAAVERHVLRHRVEQRPEHAIGVVVVIAVMLLGREVDPGELHAAQSDDFGRLRRGLHRDLAAPTEPYTATLLHPAVERDREAAGLTSPCGRDGNPIGNDDEPVHWVSSRAMGSVAKISDINSRPDFPILSDPPRTSLSRRPRILRGNIMAVPCHAAAGTIGACCTPSIFAASLVTTLIAARPSWSRAKP